MLIVVLAERLVSGRGGRLQDLAAGLGLSCLAPLAGLPDDDRLIAALSDAAVLH